LEDVGVDKSVVWVDFDPVGEDIVPVFKGRVAPVHCLGCRSLEDKVLKFGWVGLTAPTIPRAANEFVRGLESACLSIRSSNPLGSFGSSIKIASSFFDVSIRDIFDPRNARQGSRTLKSMEQRPVRVPGNWLASSSIK
jgi:hypothetical protein